jgi:hypothetical protein
MSLRFVSRRVFAEAVIAALMALLSVHANAIVLAPFPTTTGEGGSYNGQSFTIGADGSVWELDAYLGISGQDLNGSFFGSTAQLSYDPLPAGVDYSFLSPSLSLDSKDLTLSYKFTNNTSAALAGITFFSYLDADIGLSGLNETAKENGALAATQNYEVGDPNVVIGGILDDLFLGSLNGSNAFPPAPGTNGGDVAMALSFGLGDLAVGESGIIDIQISEIGDYLGSFYLTQSDLDTRLAATKITYSGAIRAATVPEPSSLALFILGVGLLYILMGRRRRVSYATGSLPVLHRS